MNNPQPPCTLALEPKVCEILARESSAVEIDIRTDGVTFMPVIYIRNRLTEAFGPLGWSLWENVPAYWNEQFREVLYDASLIVNDIPVARSRGGYAWDPPPPDQAKRYKLTTFATAVEIAKSEALQRCGKDLGIGWTLRVKSWVAKWTEENARLYDTIDYKGEIRRQWYRIDQAPDGSAESNGAARDSAPSSGRGVGRTHTGRRDTPAPSHSREDQPATDKQMHLVRRLLSELNEQDKAEILRHEGIQSLDTLGKGQASNLIDRLQKGGPL